MSLFIYLLVNWNCAQLVLMQGHCREYVHFTNKKSLNCIKKNPFSDHYYQLPTILITSLKPRKIIPDDIFNISDLY